jgi:uracil-DNA glycosylase
MPAGHGAEGEAGGYIILNRYHCSRLNTNTGRLTPEMFEAVFNRARALIDG